MARTRNDAGGSPSETVRGRLNGISRAVGALSLYALLLTTLIWVESIVLQRLGSATVATVFELAESVVWPIKDYSSVILFDGREDPKVDAAWPLGYRRWQQVALDTWCAGAKVLIFDISFAHPGEPLEGGTDTRKLFAQTLRVISGLPDPFSTLDTRKDLFKQNCSYGGNSLPQLYARASASVMPTFIAPMPGGYSDPALESLTVDVHWDGNGIYAASSNMGIPTAAAEAAKSWCELPSIKDRETGDGHSGARAGAAPGCNSNATFPSRIWLADRASTPYEQHWFSRPDPQLDTIAAPRCSYRLSDASPYARLENASLSPVITAVVDGPSFNWSVCPPVPTITSAAFDDFRSPLKIILQNRIVFVGSAHLSGLSDSVDTSLHKALPGVMIHALAADSYLNADWRLPFPAELILLVHLMLIIMIARALRPYFGAIVRDPKWLGRTLAAVLGSCFVFIDGEVHTWPQVQVLGWAILVFVALGGPQIDPADWIVKRLETLRNWADNELDKRLRPPGKNEVS